jgi:hypothetical protein
VLSVSWVKSFTFQHYLHRSDSHSGIHKAAKETIALAEQRFLSQKHEWKFDAAWQEMLNQATIRVSPRTKFTLSQH